MNVNDINFQKMKVKDLRKFVSENLIFRGGLCKLSKADIIDKILSSEWYKMKCNEIPETTEETNEEQEPETETNEVEQEQPEIETNEVETNEEKPEEIMEQIKKVKKQKSGKSKNVKKKLQKRLEILEKKLELQRLEEENLNRNLQKYNDQNKIQEMINEALEKQKRDFVNRLFT